ncbi:2341_t:CDS:2, partial [Scutellospora calospora]
MEYNFISRSTLNKILKNYVSNLPELKHKKALINPYKKTSYEHVYESKLCKNYILVNDLFERNICDEEEILSTIDIQSDSIMNLDNNINDK